MTEITRIYHDDSAPRPALRRTVCIAGYGHISICNQDNDSPDIVVTDGEPGSDQTKRGHFASSEIHNTSDEEWRAFVTIVNEADAQYRAS